MLVKVYCFIKQIGLLLLLLSGYSLGASEKVADDGPYLRYLKEDSLVAIQWVCNGKAHTQVALLEQGRVVPTRCAQRWPIIVPEKILASPKTVFESEKVAVIADVHGQFKLATELLKAQHIIDGELNWQFGKNHLVVLGDMMGRGPQVTEFLWFLYELEQQASMAGGVVHVMIGNHEAMSLQGDIRYTNQKYQATSSLLNQSYLNLFDEHTLLGRWLRTKPTMLKINNMLIVHAGVHPDVLTLRMDMAQINKRFSDTLGMPRAAVKEEADLAFLYGRDGPLWLRGYFSGRDALPANQIGRVLQHFNVDHIVVGHTSFDQVYSHYNGNVISADSNLKGGVNAEVLIWHNYKLSRGDTDGNLFPISRYSKDPT